MQITLDYLINSKLCSRDSAAKWVDPINTALERFNISTPEQVASFVSQCAHESGHFQFVKENLNYKWESLRKVFPKYFPTDELAQEYHRQPERIGARVYGGRMGNGDEASGEGFLYCGRGLIQLTGKSNYAAFSKYIGHEEILISPQLVESPTYAVLSAGWFWEVNKLNDKAGDVKASTRIINGGFNGLAERETLYAQAFNTSIA